MVDKGDQGPPAELDEAIHWTRYTTKDSTYYYDDRTGVPVSLCHLQLFPNDITQIYHHFHSPSIL